MRDRSMLIELQSMSLELKVGYSLNKISQALTESKGKMYISFSGGKDSTVLLDLVRRVNPNIPAVFIDTGLEYPEIKEFIKTIENVKIIRPKSTFKQVIDKYGFPLISKEQAQFIYEARNTHSEKLKKIRLDGIDGRAKISEKWKFLIDSPFKISHKCCDILKKRPAKIFEKESGLFPFLGIMAKESQLRTSQWIKTGCNAFNKNRPTSNPLSIWTDVDIWDYIKKFNLPYSSIYDKGRDRTGCMFCMFGIHLEKNPNRFQLMKESHPKEYHFCIDKLGCGQVLDYINIEYK